MWHSWCGLRGWTKPVPFLVTLGVCPGPARTLAKPGNLGRLAPWAFGSYRFPCDFYFKNPRSISMADVKHIGLAEVVQHFEKLQDPRSEVNRRHPLVSVVVIALMAVLAGANGPTAIAKWAKLKAEFLVKVLDLPFGIPRKDVFRRVLCLLKPGAFQAC